MRQFFCVVCEALNFRKGLLCGVCDTRVDLRVAPYSLRLEGGVRHYYLFEWTKESDLFCRRLVYFLKNKRKSQFIEWSSYFPVRLRGGEARASVVPASSTRGVVNHAKEFAESLEKLLGLTCVIEVGGNRNGPQKQKTRLERLRGPVEGLGRVRLDEGWIFIDDVFVTGGTYNKVKSVVGKPPDIILTLFYRPMIIEEEKNVF